jgi:glycosyltransferase involved in cell wall biosynthesis
VDDTAGFVIVGAYPKKELLEEAEKFRNVHVTGFVEDPYRYAYESCGMVAPMQTGGGIQNKVLEGMALGKVNIVSSLAAGPIVGAKHGENMFIVDDPAEYVRVVKDLVQSKNADSGIGEKALLVQGSGTIEDGEGLKSEDQYTKIEKNARNLIRNQFTWERYKSVLLESI